MGSLIVWQSVDSAHFCTAIIITNEHKCSVSINNKNSSAAASKVNLVLEWNI